MLKGALGGGKEEDGVGAKAIRRSGLDVRDEVLGFRKVNVGLLLETDKVSVDSTNIQPFHFSSQHKTYL